jgi:hypothetical protein
LTTLATLCVWVVVRYSFEGSSVLFFWKSDVQDWRMLAARLPLGWLWLVAIVGGLMLGTRVLSRVPEHQPSRPGVVLASLGLAALWVARPEMLLAQPWSGWGTNELAQSSKTFYVIHPLVFDPVCAFGCLGVLFLATRKGFTIVCATWVGLFCFLTVWGNFQSRYGLPLLPLQIVLAVQVLREFSNGSPRLGWRKVLVSVVLVISLARSMWLDWTLALSNDFFYF